MPLVSDPFSSSDTNYGAIIAPFFADVDTRVPDSSGYSGSQANSGFGGKGSDTSFAPQPILVGGDAGGSSSGTVSYYPTTVDGRQAFKVEWDNVDYYNVYGGSYDPTTGQYLPHQSKYDTFSLTLVNRSDVLPGDFDIDFDYGSIAWDTGDASGGQNGLSTATSGYPARIGYSDGTGRDGTFFEVTGSGQPGAFLGSGPGHQHFEIRAAAVLEWNTDDNGPYLQGALVPRAGDAPIMLAEYQIGDQLGGNNVNVDWGDGEAQDDGSTVHFYDSGSYGVNADINGKTTSIATDISHTSNNFDRPVPQANIDWSVGSGTGESDLTSSGGQMFSSAAAPAGAAIPGVPAKLIKQDASFGLAQEAPTATVDAINDLRAKDINALPNGSVFVGLYDLKLTGTKVVIPSGKNFITRITIHATGPFLALNNLTKQADGTYWSSGNYDTGAKLVRRFAQLEGLTVNDDGKGNLDVALNDDTALIYYKDQDFGSLNIVPNGGKGGKFTKVQFGSAYKEFYITSAAGADITEIDRLDGPAFDTFVEEKDGTGLLKVDPAKQAAEVTRWIKDNVTDKLPKILGVGAGAAGTRKGKNYIGSESGPGVSELKAIMKIRFEIKAGARAVPGLEAGIDAVLQSFMNANRGWSATLKFV